LQFTFIRVIAIKLSMYLEDIIFFYHEGENIIGTARVPTLAIVSTYSMTQRMA